MITGSSCGSTKIRTQKLQAVTVTLKYDTNQIQTSSLFIQVYSYKFQLLAVDALLQSDSIHDFGHKVSSSIIILTMNPDWSLQQYDGLCLTLTRSHLRP